MPELEVDFYFSFRSPWSYFAAVQMDELRQEYAMRVNLLVVNPIYIRYNEFFDKSHEKWGSYFLTDLMRYSEYRGIPIGMPRPDPINQALAADDPGHLVNKLSPLGLSAEIIRQDRHVRNLLILKHIFEVCEFLQAPLLAKTS